MMITTHTTAHRIQRTASSAPHPAHRIPVRDPTDQIFFRGGGGAGYLHSTGA